MTDRTPSRAAALAALLSAALAAPALAQDAAADAVQPAPAQDSATAATPEATGTGTATAEAPVGDAANTDNLSLGQNVDGATPAAAPGDGVGTPYVREEFGDWQMRCIRAPEGQEDPCQLYQLLRDETDNAVAEISMFSLPAGSEAAAGATIITPLETLLTEQLTISVDSSGSKRYPFTWCSAIGCFARVGFTTAEVNTFKRGNVAKITIVPVAAPDQKVVLDVSLSGFTAGLAAVDASNAAVGGN